jgi:queuine tRNA-ribosyltransferase
VFNLEKSLSGTRARAASLMTAHGVVETPVFMPVGTLATVRGQTRETLLSTGAQVLLANTYHLLLRPGIDVFRKFGGIHSFMNWPKAVLTDSGGYQIFSLPEGRRITQDGAVFTSPIDGKRILLDPETSIATQSAIGADIMMALDQCIPSTAERAEAEAAMRLTHAWAQRSLNARQTPQALFGIVQGACFDDLRAESARVLREMPFDGFAIGGLAVGESREEREHTTEIVTDLLPMDRPRYLMGVGTPIDLLEAVHRGVDMFDCILPTAFAQQGVAFTSLGKLDLRRGAYKLAEERLDPACPCPTCADYSRAYLHHLIKSKEVLGWSLIGSHNLAFYHRLTREMREHIWAGTFLGYYGRQREVLDHSDDELYPKRPPKPSRTGRPSARLGRFELWRTPLGFGSVKEIASGEVMHPVDEPSSEAKALYIDQSQIEHRLAAGESITLWDVGMGVATNAMQAVFAAERAGSGKLHIVSFENDLDSLRLAMKHSSYFPWLWHAAPAAVLGSGRWASEDGRITWELLEGDFLERMLAASPPDLIFYDFFSFKTDLEVWRAPAFVRLADKTLDLDCELYTFSRSTAVRAALLAAGFSVAVGTAIDAKSETTVALTPLAALRAGDRWSAQLLDCEWLQKWERSSVHAPDDLDSYDAADFERRVRRHPQFSRVPTSVDK